MRETLLNSEFLESDWPSLAEAEDFPTIESNLHSSVILHKDINNMPRYDTHYLYKQGQ